MKKVVTGSLESGNLTPYYSPKALASSIVQRSLVTLNQEAGHPSLEYLRKIYPSQNIPKLNFIMCSTCKMTKIPFPGSFPQATQKLASLHMDLCGPISPPYHTKTKMKQKFLRNRTVNIKITHLVKFLPTEFPFLKEVTPDDNNSFILVPNETKKIPIKDITSTNDSIESNIPTEIEQSRGIRQDPPIEDSPSMRTQMPTLKGYSWVPETKSIPQNEILGDVGNTRNNLTHQKMA
ncbi:hypothetical protein O181_019490 [Austropuccinia psidii MF-1]|uniref:Uncharacterized protein n=1 Tax=Austropuccinia psidii MF-1 TaxID=1389203 RepID=A0A9Q3CBW8_9BASI|nr:hypothetical protein [Austropuccinia psidii MF-1]